MIKGCKICGIKDSDTLNYIINKLENPNWEFEYEISQ